MKNLKRIFSLALAIVMVMGMMVVGASATDFIDDADIEHGAAADVMNALNIIGGYEDKSFRPNGDVTRAQMAKMIAYALNGGKAPNVGLPTTPTFTDVSLNYWGAEVIEYCYNLGIIGGRGNGIFDPEGKVTAAEAAKMILVALGFDAEVFELGGANWSTNTMKLAQSLLISNGTSAEALKAAKPLSLFSGIASIGANTPLNRDQAAQLIYNGIRSNTVIMALTGVTSGSNTGLLGDVTGAKPTYSWTLTGDSILVDKFGADVKTGLLTDVDYADGDWFYTVTVGSGEDADDLQYVSNADVTNLFQQNVQVVAIDNVALAITSASNDVVSSGVIGALKLGKNSAGTVTKLDGNAFAADLPVYSLTTLDVIEDEDITSYSGKIYDQYCLIDNNGDGTIDCALVLPVTVTYVKNAVTKSITLNGVAQPVTYADNDIEAGLVKGQYVTVTENYLGVKTVKAAETMTALVDGTRTNNGTTTLRVEGKWYTVTSDFIGGEPAELNGEECDLVLVAGYIVAGAPVGETIELSDAVMVVTVAAKTGETGDVVDVSATKYLQIRVLKGDGNTEVLNVVAIDKNADGEIAADEKISSENDIEKGQVYTYAKAGSSNYYNLTPYEGDEGYDAMNATAADAISVSRGLASQADSEITFRFANDAKVFVLAKNGKYAVVSGADVNKWGARPYPTKTGDANSALYATTSANGFTYVQLGFLVLENNAIPGQGTTTTTGYGIVTSNAVRVYDSNNKQYALNLTIWNGTEEIEVLTATESTDKADTNSFKAGTVVTYTDNNNGYITWPTNLSDKLDAVIAYDDIDTLKFAKIGTVGDSDEFVIDDNTVILFVDAANAAGVEEGNIVLASLKDEDDPTLGYIANVWVDVDTDEHTINYLIVDVSDSQKTVVGAASEDDEPEAPAEKTAESKTLSESKKFSEQGIAADTVFTLDSDSLSKINDSYVTGWGIQAGDVDGFTFIAYTADGQNNVTLKIEDAEGKEIYSETSSAARDAGTQLVCFYKNNTKGGTAPWKNSATELTTGSKYVVTVTCGSYEFAFTYTGK